MKTYTTIVHSLSLTTLSTLYPLQHYCTYKNVLKNAEFDILLLL